MRRRGSRKGEGSRSVRRKKRSRRGNASSSVRQMKRSRRGDGRSSDRLKRRRDRLLRGRPRSNERPVSRLLLKRLRRGRLVKGRSSSVRSQVKVRNGAMLTLPILTGTGARGTKRPTSLRLHLTKKTATMTAIIVRNTLTIAVAPRLSILMATLHPSSTKTTIY